MVDNEASSTTSPSQTSSQHAESPSSAEASSVVKTKTTVDASPSADSPANPPAPSASTRSNTVSDSKQEGNSIRIEVPVQQSPVLPVVSSAPNAPTPQATADSYNTLDNAIRQYTNELATKESNYNILNNELAEAQTQIKSDRIRLQKIKSESTQLKSELDNRKTSYEAYHIEKQSIEGIISEISQEIQDERLELASLNKSYSSKSQAFAQSVLELSKLESSIEDLKAKKSALTNSIVCQRSVNMTCEDGNTPVLLLETYTRNNLPSESFQLAAASDVLPRLEALYVCFSWYVFTLEKPRARMMLRLTNNGQTLSEYYYGEFASRESVFVSFSIQRGEEFISTFEENSRVEVWFYVGNSTDQAVNTVYVKDLKISGDEHSECLYSDEVQLNLKSAISDKQRQLDHLQTTDAHWTDYLSQHANSSEQLLEEQNNLQMEITSLNRKYGSIQAQESDSESTITSLKSDNIDAQMADQVKSNATVQSQLDAMSATLNVKQKSLDALKTQLGSLEKQIIQTNMSLEQKSHQVNELNQELSSAQTYQAKLQTQLHAASAANADVNAVSLNLQKTKANLSQQSQTLASQYNDQISVKNNLLTAIQKLQVEYGNADEQVESASENKINRYNEYLVSMKERDTLYGKYKQINDTKFTLDQSIAQNAAKIKTLTASQQQAQASLTQMDTRLSATQESHDLAREKVAELESQLQSTTYEVSQTRVQLMHVKSKITTFEQTILKYRQNIDSIKELALNKQTEYDAAVRKCDAESREEGDAVYNWQESLAEFSRTLGKNPWSLEETANHYGDPYYLNSYWGGSFNADKQYLTNVYSGINTNLNADAGSESEQPFNFTMRPGEYIVNLCYDFGVSLNMLEIRTNNNSYKAGASKSAPTCLKIEDSEHGIYLLDMKVRQHNDRVLKLDLQWVEMGGNN